MENKMQKIRLRLVNKIGELEKIHDALESLSDEWGLPPQLCMSINLGLEEAFTNIVNYAYRDDAQHIIEIDIVLEGTRIVIEITDDGQPYDPTKADDPDIDLPAADRPVGGLGIFLIRKIMDAVQYKRTGNKNQLILTKTINQ